MKEQKKAAAVITPTSPLPTPSMGPDPQYHQLSNSRSNPSMPLRPTVTAPQPLRALDRRPSGSGLTGRNRSPTSSTAFSDLAHQGKVLTVVVMQFALIFCQGKKQLNQLIGFLDKGSSANSLGGNRESQALRTVRTKREADEAGTSFSLCDRGSSPFGYQIKSIGKVSTGWKPCDCDVQKSWKVDTRHVHGMDCPRGLPNLNPRV